jgi:peptidoglycan L-alanyl-D-glutamate endopeptidase CwlK
MISRDKALLCPAFIVRLNEFERRLSIDHLPFYMFEGLRSFERSDELYAQGRTKPGKIVTNAKGGDSIHNYGLAADYVLDGDIDKPDIQWSWENRNGIYQSMGAVAEACGLVWGGRWKRFPDLPHVEMPGLTLTTIKEIYRRSNGDLKILWTYYEIQGASL